MPLAYAADSWGKSRFVVAKIEVSDKGDNPRFIVTSLLEEKARELYRDLYCARGDTWPAAWRTASKISS
ncbi:MAG: transposase [Hahellaceae bacterium]|nr:transposase [Hahellaceae bacterium]